MHSKMKLLALATLGALVITLTPGARADEWNQKTVFTFSGPVEIPGQALGPGTYVFRLMGSMADRNIVQVFNKNETHCYGTFLAIPDYRLKPTGKPIIMFEERAEGSPEAVKAWFYPGDTYGHEFVYPAAKAQQLASLNHQSVASMPQEMSENTAATTVTSAPVTEMAQAPLSAQSETKQQSETAEAPPPPATTEANTPPPATSEASRMPEQLPQTGSDLPVIALFGMLSLTSAFLLRWVRVN